MHMAIPGTATAAAKPAVPAIVADTGPSTQARPMPRDTGKIPGIDGNRVGNGPGIGDPCIHVAVCERVAGLVIIFIERLACFSSESAFSLASSNATKMEGRVQFSLSRRFYLLCASEQAPAGNSYTLCIAAPPVLVCGWEAGRVEGTAERRGVCIQGKGRSRTDPKTPWVRTEGARAQSSLQTASRYERTRAGRLC